MTFLENRALRLLGMEVSDSQNETSVLVPVWKTDKVYSLNYGLTIHVMSSGCGCLMGEFPPTKLQFEFDKLLLLNLLFI